MTRRIGIVLLVALAVAAVAAPARAVGAFGPTVTVVDLGCTATDFAGAAAAVATGASGHDVVLARSQQ